MTTSSLSPTSKKKSLQCLFPSLSPQMSPSMEAAKIFCPFITHSHHYSPTSSISRHVLYLPSHKAQVMLLFFLMGTMFKTPCNSHPLAKSWRRKWENSRHPEVLVWKRQNPRKLPFNRLTQCYRHKKVGLSSSACSPLKITSESSCFLHPLLQAYS